MLKLTLSKTSQSGRVVYGRIKHSYRKTFLYNWTRNIILFKKWLGWNPESLTPFRMGFHNFPSFHPDLYPMSSNFWSSCIWQANYLLRCWPRKRGQGPSVRILGRAGRHLWSGRRDSHLLGRLRGCRHWGAAASRKLKWECHQSLCQKHWGASAGAPSDGPIWSFAVSVYTCMLPRQLSQNSWHSLRLGLLSTWVPEYLWAWVLLLVQPSFSWGYKDSRADSIRFQVRVK